MQKNSKVRVYGKAKGEKKDKFFSGEVVSINSIFKNNFIVFYMYNDKFIINKKKCEPIQFLYPNFIYVNDSVSQVDLTSDKTEVCQIKAANCYARQGSHWLKYILCPENLSAQPGDKDSDFCDQFGQEIGTLSIDREELKYNLHKNGFSKKTIIKIMKSIMQSS